MPLRQAQRTDLANLWGSAIAAIEYVAEQVKRKNADEPLDEISALLEALPVASSDYCRLSNNLRNADRYMRSEEWGAAAYELRMMATSVRNCRSAFGGKRLRARSDASELD